MINHIKKIIIGIIFLLLLISGLVIFAHYHLSSRLDRFEALLNDNSKVHVTDTIPVKRIEHIKVYSQDEQKPIQVFVQVHIDSSYRKQVEKQTIVTDEKIENNKLDVTTIDTAGKVQEKVYDINNNSDIKMDNQGNVEITVDKKKVQKERIKKVLNTAKDIGIVILGVMIGKVL
jgi:hypothetical protein